MIPLPQADSPVAAGVRTLAELFAWRVRRTPDAIAYRQFDRPMGAWRDVSWAGIRERAQRFEAALSAAGIVRGARVATLLPNGIDAVCVDQAALAKACVPVPMHVLDNPASIAWILADSSAAVLFASSQAQWDAIAGVGIPCPDLRLVVVSGELSAPAASARPSIASMPRASEAQERRPCPWPERRAGRRPWRQSRSGACSRRRNSGPASTSHVAPSLRVRSCSMPAP